MNKLHALYNEIIEILNNNPGDLIVSANVGTAIKTFYDLKELTKLEKMALMDRSDEIKIGKLNNNLIIVNTLLDYNDPFVYRYGNDEDTQYDLFWIQKLINF